MNLKQRKLNGVKSWIAGARRHTNGQYLLNKVTDIDERLAKLSGPELSLIMSLLAATYSKGCDDTRVTFTSMRKRKPVPADSHIKAVV